MPTKSKTVRGHPLGAIEMADFLGVKRATVQQWSFRDSQARKKELPPVLPPRDYTVGGFPAWERDTIVQWALDTGRLDVDDPRAEGFEPTVGSPGWAATQRAEAARSADAYAETEPTASKG